jgi:hypothetical protein
VTNIAKQNVDIGNGVELVKVEKFCYLGDMLDAEGGADLAVATRVRCAWKKFKRIIVTLFNLKKGFLKAERESMQVV